MKTCKFPRGYLGDIEFGENCEIDDERRAEVGCIVTFICQKDHIYFHPYTMDRTKGVNVQCIAHPDRDEGIWKTNPIEGRLEPCIGGCLTSNDCTANGMAPCRECHGEHFKCVEKQCYISDPNVVFLNQMSTCPSSSEYQSCKSSNNGMLEADNLITKGTIGTATCKRGYVFFLGFGHVNKSVELRCCDKDPKNDVCKLDWGLTNDCQNVSVECKEGCIPKGPNNLNSDDCEEEEKCVNNECVPKMCEIPINQNYHLTGKRMIDINKGITSSQFYGSYVKPKINTKAPPSNSLKHSIGSHHELCCNFGYVFYLHGPMKTKCINVSCQIDDTNLKAKFKTEPGHGSLPDCQTGCLTNEDCRNSTHDNSICNNRTCTWPCEGIDAVENGNVSISDLKLESKADIICNKGYLIRGDTKRKVTLHCLYQVGEGSRWCRLDNGVCEVPSCIKGCLEGSDCKSKEVCTASELLYNGHENPDDQIRRTQKTMSSCLHEKCCEPITCPDKISGLNGLLLLKYSNNVLGVNARFQCDNDAVYSPMREPEDDYSYLEPQSWVPVLCQRKDTMDKSGNWVAIRDGNSEPLQPCELNGCNLDDRRVSKPCYFCKQDIWKVTPKSCPSTIGTFSNIHAEYRELGSTGVLNCKSKTFVQPFEHIKSEHGHPIKSVSISCVCGVDNMPEWKAQIKNVTSGNQR